MSNVATKVLTNPKLLGLAALSALAAPTAIDIFGKAIELRSNLATPGIKSNTYNTNVLLEKVVENTKPRKAAIPRVTVAPQKMEERYLT